MIKEQAFKVALQYINGTDKEREAILSCFNGAEREVFLKGVGSIHLFVDADYYNAVQTAVKEKFIEEVYGGKVS